MSGNSWGAKHKGLLAIVGAAAATALTAGAASPALAAALGGTAAAEGAGAAGAGALGAGAAGLGATEAGLGTASLFGPTAGGSALAGSAAIPSITSAGAAGTGLGGGTSSLFGGQGLLAGSSPEMFTAGLGSGSGGASLPTFGDKVASGISNVLPGGNDTLSSLKSGMGKLQKAQQAYKQASGLLGGPPRQASGGGVPPSQAFGAKASPVNLTQFTSQANSMAPQQPQLPPQLAMLPPNDPRVLAYLQQMGGMYG